MGHADLPSGEDTSSNFVDAGFVAEHHAIISEIVTPDSMREGVSPSYFTRLLHLSYLAPDITEDRHSA
jgi:hypothetical protein